MKKLLSLIALAVAATALVACGGSSDNSSTSTTSGGGGGGGAGAAGGGAGAAGGGGGAAAAGGGSTVRVSADPSGALKFNTTKLTAKAGSDTFDFTNDAPLSHDFTIESSSGQKVGATPIFQGGTKSFTATLKPGTYKFLCTVPGHAPAGMEGTLTVK